MGTRFHIGAKDLRGDIAAYAKRFDLLEVHPAPADDGALGPSLATMRRWRKATPPHFEFTVVAGPSLSRLKPGAALDKEVAAALEAADALRARCLLLQTPPEVTPSSLWRERMVKVLGRLRREATTLVWEPRGLWETDDAARAAQKWGVVLALDASREPVPEGPIAYVRLRMLGETRSFGPSTLERVVHAIGDRADAYVVLETPTALKECKRLRQLAQRPRAKSGGTGRLLRPAGGVVVGEDDDE
jgi:uncharacterized protein YecE (DUF72 family)